MGTWPSRETQNPSSQPTRHTGFKAESSKMTYSRASPSELGGGALCQPTAEPPPVIHGGIPKGTKGGQIPWLKRKRLKTRACFSLLAVQPTEPKARSDQGSACPVPGPVPQAFFSSRKAKRLASPYRDRDSGLRGHTGLNQGVYRMLSCHQRRQGWTEHRQMWKLYENFHNSMKIQENMNVTR